MMPRRLSRRQQLAGVDRALWESDRWLCVESCKSTSAQRYSKDTNSTHPFNPDPIVTGNSIPFNDKSFI